MVVISIQITQIKLRVVTLSPWWSMPYLGLQHMFEKIWPRSASGIAELRIDGYVPKSAQLFRWRIGQTVGSHTTLADGSRTFYRQIAYPDCLHFVHYV